MYAIAGFESELALSTTIWRIVYAIVGFESELALSTTIWRISIVEGSGQSWTTSKKLKKLYFYRTRIFARECTVRFVKFTFHLKAFFVLSQHFLFPAFVNSIIGILM